jgi:thiol-disulfide isomerase/thioredoxin
MNKTILAAFALGTLGFAGIVAQGEPVGRPAPEFTQTRPEAWINSPPLTLQKLRGNVVLLDVWAFECWNCYRSFPWLLAVEQRYAPRGLKVVGIHSPELPAEHDRARLVRKIGEYGLKHPIMIDDDFAYFRSLDNRAWPAYYLIDKRGVIRYRFYGETHQGDARAQEIEGAIARLTSEQ